MLLTLPIARSLGLNDIFVLIVCFQFTEGTYSFKVKVNVHSSCFHEVVVFTNLFICCFYIQSTSQQSTLKKILDFIQKKIIFAPFKIKLTLSASESRLKHNRIKCCPKNCKHVYHIGTVVAKKKITIKIYARFFQIVHWWTELQEKKLCSFLVQLISKVPFLNNFGKLSLPLCVWLQNCHQLV